MYPYFKFDARVSASLTFFAYIEVPSPYLIELMIYVASFYPLTFNKLKIGPKLSS